MTTDEAQNVLMRQWDQVWALLKSAGADEFIEPAVLIRMANNPPSIELIERLQYVAALAADRRNAGSSAPESLLDGERLVIVMDVDGSCRETMVCDPKQWRRWYSRAAEVEPKLAAEADQHFGNINA
jgi:hypothetical protein